MPTLPFLKKKRTKDSPGQKDPSSSSTSPITPTTSKGFDNSIDTVSTQSTAPTLGSTASSGTPEKDGSSSAGQQQLTMQGIAQQQQPQQHQPYGGAQLSPSSVHPGQPNLPTINNLINPPQHEGTAHAVQSPMASNSGLTTANGSPAQQDGQHHQHVAQDQVRQTKGKYSLNDFELLRTLGTGSFGRVQLVQSKHNQRFYAVKILKKYQVVRMKQVEHTNDERRMLQDVKHPFLITLWGTFQDNRNLYMVMDFVEGGELFSLLRKSQVSYHPRMEDHKKRPLSL